MKGQKNDCNDAEAIAAAAPRPNLRLAWAGSTPALNRRQAHPGMHDQAGPEVSSHPVHPGRAFHPDAAPQLGEAELRAVTQEASARLHRNKLAVALANKLAGIAWSVLRHQRRLDGHTIEAGAI